VLLRDTGTASDAELIAQRLIDRVSQPYEIERHDVMIGISIGIAVAPDDGEAAEVLQIRADLALYAAKGAGRGRAAFSDARLDATVEA